MLTAYDQSLLLYSLTLLKPLSGAVVSLAVCWPSAPGQFQRLAVVLLKLLTGAVSDASLSRCVLLKPLTRAVSEARLSLAGMT